jgi:hypothetical protein
VLVGETSLQAGSLWAVLWAGPGIPLASLMSQFFLAQGIALAVLALLADFTGVLPSKAFWRGIAR